MEALLNKDFVWQIFFRRVGMAMDFETVPSSKVNAMVVPSNATRTEYEISRLFHWPIYEKGASMLHIGCFKKTLFQKNKKRNPPRISLGVSLNRSKRIFDFDQV